MFKKFPSNDQTKENGALFDICISSNIFNQQHETVDENINNRLAYICSTMHLRSGENSFYRLINSVNH